MCTEQWLLNPSCGSGEAEGGMRLGLTGRPVLSGSQVYTIGTARMFYTFPKTSGTKWGGVRWGTRRRYRKLQGSSLKVPWYSVNNSSQAASSCESQDNGKEGRWGAGGGGREGGRRRGWGRHSSSCSFRICVHICVPSSEKEKFPPKPHPAPALSV